MSFEELIINKFHSCTGVQKHIINGWLNNPEPEGSEFDLIKVKSIINQSQMQVFEKLLLRFMIFKRGQIDCLKNTDHLILDHSVEKIDGKLEIVNFLEHILSKEEITSVQINQARGGASLNDKILIDLIIDTVKQEFEKRNYHITSLTIAEAEHIYIEQTDKIWFEEWKSQFNLIDEQGATVKFDEMKEGKHYFDQDYDDIADLKSSIDDMLYSYAISHSLKRDIDLNLIDILKTLLETEKKERTKSSGVGEINRIISLVAIALADLMRVEEFLSKTDIQNIDDISVSNNAGRFINDLFLCFGMIENKAKPGRETERYRYVKDLIRNKLEQKTPDPQLLLRSERLKNLKSEFPNFTGGVNP